MGCLWLGRLQLTGSDSRKNEKAALANSSWPGLQWAAGSDGYKREMRLIRSWRNRSRKERGQVRAGRARVDTVVSPGRCGWGLVKTW